MAQYQASAVKDADTDRRPFVSDLANAGTGSVTLKRDADEKVAQGEVRHMS